MNENGEGPKRGLYGRMPDDVFSRPGKPTPKTATPEEGCFTCLGGALLLLISIAFWGWYYWQNNPEFHPRNTKPSPSATTRQIRK